MRPQPQEAKRRHRGWIQSFRRTMYDDCCDPIGATGHLRRRQTGGSHGGLGMTMRRRDFVKGASFALAAAAFAEEHAARLPIAFSTLGCPDWEIKKILDFAADHGYA